MYPTYIYLYYFVRVQPLTWLTAVILGYLCEPLVFSVFLGLY